MIQLETMKLGTDGPSISRLGMGCWAIGGHGWGEVDDNDSIRAVRCAFEHGVTFYDTADAYGLGYSEKLLVKALGEHRKDVVIATKGGVRWNSKREVWTDISPTYLRTAVESSLCRLKLDQIPLYYVHKPDGRTSISESVAELEQLRQEGKIGAIGLANFSVVDLVNALKVAPISAVQVRLNMFDHDAVNDYLQLCRENNVTLVAWGALADGLLTGKFNTDTTFPEADHRSRMPDFIGERYLQNLKCINYLKQWADARDIKMAQLALRWVLDSAPITCALFGAKTDVQVKNNLVSKSWRLSREDLIGINEIVERIRR